MSEQQPPPGWYPQGNEQRYWDGTQWTDQRAPLAPSGGVTYAQPPQKKSHVGRNIAIAAVLLLVLFVGGCLAVVVAGGNAVNDAVNDSIAEDSEPGGPDNPLEITEGEAFEVADFKYAAGWTVTKEFGLVGVEGLKVTNERDDKDSALVEIKFWKGSEVLALVDCTTEPIAVDTTTRLNCGSGDDYPKGYDRITINDTF